MKRATSRRQWLAGLAPVAALAAGGAGLLRGAQQASGTAAPNVVLILSDDQGYGDLGCYGGAHLRTPRIDSLSAKGVRFTRFYANAPECTPTRTALLTGRYQQRVGGLECAIGVGNVGRYDEAEWLQQRGELGLPVAQSVLASSLKQAGYATACIGKWHLGYDAAFAPRKHGFDSYWGPLGGTVDYFHYREPTGQEMLFRNEKPERTDGYLTDRIAEEAVGWLTKQRGPFFLYVPFTAPHTPYQHEDDAGKEVNESNWNQGTKETYARMIGRLDQAVGRILDALDESGKTANTLVIFASDNGATRMGNNGGFRGNKGLLFEGGIRVPCLARWPGVLPENRQVAFPAMTMDWTATILKACGAHSPRPLDGVDLLPALREEAGGAVTKKLAGRELFFRYKRMKARRKAMMVGEWKYVIDGEQEYLFHLSEDPREGDNRIERELERAEQMRRRLAAWEAEVRAPRLRDFRA